MILQLEICQSATQEDNMVVTRRSSASGARRSSRYSPEVPIQFEKCIEKYILSVRARYAGNLHSRTIEIFGTDYDDWTALLTFEETPNKKNVRKTEGEFEAFFSLADWDAIVDILRNERPLYFGFHGLKSDGTVEIKTRKEPPGEEEGGQ
jgi:hypothetical protein